MKKIIPTIIAAGFLSQIFGCSIMHSMSSQEYIAYVNAEKEYLVALLKLQEANLQPKTLVEFPGVDGNKIVVYQQQQPIDMSKMPRPQQKTPSEWVPVIQSFVNSAGVVGGIFVAGNAVKGIVTSVGNSAGHNMTNSNNGQVNTGSGTLSTGSGQIGNNLPIANSYNQANPNNITPTTNTTNTSVTNSNNPTSTTTDNSVTDSNNPTSTITDNSVTDSNNSTSKTKTITTDNSVADSNNTANQGL